MSPPRLTEASLHSARSGTILPTYDRERHAHRHRAHRAGRVSSRAPGVLRRHAAALGQALGDLRAVAQEHRAARCARPTAGPVHAGGARRRAARARHRRNPRVAGGRDGYGRARSRALTARDTRIVSLTVTEKGYCLDAKNQLDLANADIAHDLANPAQPRSTIGWIVEGLRRRRAQGCRRSRC